MAPLSPPSLDGVPNFFDGQGLNRQGLRSLEVTLAFDGAEGGFLRGVELFPNDFPVKRVGVLRRASGTVRRGPANVPGQPPHADELEAARSVGVRVDLDRLPESEPELSEVEGVQVLAARLQPERGFLLERRPRVVRPRGGCGKFLGACPG